MDGEEAHRAVFLTSELMDLGRVGTTIFSCAPLADPNGYFQTQHHNNCLVDRLSGSQAKVS